MLLKRFYDERLAQASYIIGCQVTGEAVVVDPNRETERYVDAASAEGMTVRYVTETHIHADFLSGARQLARRTGAELLLSDHGGDDWSYGFAEEDGVRLVRDGDVIELGNVRFEVMHSPGHTPEHISFVVTDGATSDVPMGVLTGDFVFVGDVGRPDLLEKAAGYRDTMEEGARVLHASLQRFRSLPGHVQILPGHGAGSACGKALGAVPTSTLGYELLVNWAFRCETEEEFVRQVLADQPEPPAYFAHMKRMNRDGPRLLDAAPDPLRLEPDRLGAVLADGGFVLDTRPRNAFAAGHIPGTVNIPLGGDFVGRCGWFAPYDAPLHLLVPDADDAREAAGDLSLIGLDDVTGYFDGSALEAWETEHGELESYPVVDWAAAEAAIRDERATLLDVRGLSEWNEGHVDGAVHVHMGHLRDRIAEIPSEGPILVYCRTGNRSAVAASVLQAMGRPDVRNIEGGIVERARRGLGVEAA